jgi:glycosyltransferase involved in cell wall biosynthesis
MANYGLSGTRLDVQGIKVFPNGREKWGNDIVSAYADDWDTDLVVTLYDVWPLNFARRSEWKRKWIPWVPIDHEEVPPPVLESLRYAHTIVAMSRHGQAALERAGLESVYIPHGVDLSVYGPGDPMEARANLDLPKDRFIVGMVAANNFNPSRKCIPQVCSAFADALKDNPELLLYLHTVDDESKKGIDIHAVLRSLGLTVDKDVIISDQYDYQLGYPVHAMADLYRSFDVLANPAMGEGFGIPMIEAMACGTPVIATRGTSMTEIVSDDDLLVDGDPFWSPQGAWQTIPSVQGIARKIMRAAFLAEAYPEKWAQKSQYAREWVEVNYSATEVVAAWDSLLRSVP